MMQILSLATVVVVVVVISFTLTSPQLKGDMQDLTTEAIPT
jgi:hypothetical protein